MNSRPVGLSNVILDFGNKQISFIAYYENGSNEFKILKGKEYLHVLSTATHSLINTDDTFFNKTIEEAVTGAILLPCSTVL